MTAFNQGMAGLIRKCKLDAPTVVRKEAGQLIKELVDLSPPSNKFKGGSKSKTAKSIADGVMFSFQSISDARNSDASWLGKSEKSGIRWFSVDSNFLHGVAPARDMRKASVEELRRLRFAITKSGKRLNQPIKGHAKQRALIYQTIITKAATLKKLIPRLQKNIGRLKAGWLVAVTRGQAVLSGKQPPQWVTDHATGARGDTVNGLAIPNNPSLTIINSAKGISQKGVDFIVSSAVRNRAAKMAAVTREILAGSKIGQKRLLDYAK